MPGHPGNDVDRHSQICHHRDVRVPQTMDGDGPDARLVAQLVKQLPHRVRIGRHAVRARNHVVIDVSPQLAIALTPRSFPGLALFQGTQHGHCFGKKMDGADARLVFRGLSKRAAVNGHGGLHDPQRSTLEINPRPPQTARFTAAHAGQRHQAKRWAVPVFARCRDELLRFLLGPGLGPVECFQIPLRLLQCLFQITGSSGKLFESRVDLNQFARHGTGEQAAQDGENLVVRSWAEFLLCDDFTELTNGFCVDLGEQVAAKCRQNVPSQHVSVACQRLGFESVLVFLFQKPRLGIVLQRRRLPLHRLLLAHLVFRLLSAEGFVMKFFARVVDEVRVPTLFKPLVGQGKRSFRVLAAVEQTLVVDRLAIRQPPQDPAPAKLARSHPDSIGLALQLEHRALPLAFFRLFILRLFFVFHVVPPTTHTGKAVCEIWNGSERYSLSGAFCVLHCTGDSFSRQTRPWQATQRRH
ncbi:hypothetical protein BOO71_0000928 [Deinococcus marmoris]|uniref:Uncharacterized protein n=1 Tax=Deinococcus marmoris TaxID=249408 RepID=A0A1U7P4G3_9DEIO|nr:hypothetical protein BOO71_0000928 [Deinococcus marmoris]